MRDQTGLRERKKAAVRSALTEAAIRLAIEHGVEQVTTDAIAAAADVAPRTFRNYFSSKEEAILAPLSAQVRSLADLIRARPAHESVWEAVRAAIRTALDDWLGDLATLNQQHKLITSSPSLTVRFLGTCEEVERLMAEAIADRAGVDARTHPYPILQAGVVVLVLRTAMDLRHSPDTVDLPGLVDRAFDLVRAGLPQPPATGRAPLTAIE